MAIFRVEKNKNYTTMANYHFMDKSLSWKAKGILSNMLSLPDDWDYSLAGLQTLSSDGMSATRAAIKELEEHGYLIRKPIRTNGKFSDWEYIIFEKPQIEKPVAENQQVENPQVENHTQLSTNELIPKELSTKEERKKAKASYDEIIDEMISDDELKNAIREFIKMRKLIKKPLTDNALKLAIKKLQKLSNSVYDQIEIVNTAVMNSWQGFYPLEKKGVKNYGNQRSRQLPQQPISKNSGGYKGTAVEL